MSTSAGAHSPLPRRPKSRLSVDVQMQCSLSAWYADVSEDSRIVMSSIDQSQFRSAALYGESEDCTPQRISPMFAVRSARTPAGTTKSPRHAVIARRRYEVVTADHSPLLQGTLSQAPTPRSRPCSRIHLRGSTARSPGRLNAAITPATGSDASQCFAQTPFFALPASPRPHSFFLSVRQLEQPAHPTLLGQQMRENKRNDESLVTSSNDLTNTDDGSLTHAKTPNIRSNLGNRTPRSDLGQVKRDSRPETPCVLSPLLTASTPQKRVQRVRTPTTHRPQTMDFHDTLRASQPTGNGGYDSLQRDNLDITLGRESRTCDRVCGTPRGKLLTAIPPTHVQSSLSSTASLHRSFIGHTGVKSSFSMTTSRKSPTAGAAAGVSDGGNQSSMETHNLTARSLPTVSIRQSSVSFVSCRSLFRQFVQRWRYRHEENKNAYARGGYMAVTPGKKLNSRYVVVHKLGWGEFSTVWLAYDTLHKTLGKQHQAFVALKIAKCDNVVSQSSQYEINLLRYIGVQASSWAPITSLVDCFEVAGQYGSHMCMVMPLHGSNLLSIIDQMKAKKCVRSAPQIRLIKEIVASTLLGLEELDRLDIIHTDIKPENILCSSPDPKVLDVIETFCQRNKEHASMVPYEALQDCVSQGDPNHLVCLADFGLSVALKPPNTLMSTSRGAKSDQTALGSLLGSKKEFLVEKAGTVTNLHGTMIQTREYRAPEVLIGLDFNTRTDLWSVGCMVFELITGEFLMDPKRCTRNERMMDVEHLVMMMQLLGPVPEEIVRLRTSQNLRRPPPRYIHRYFDEYGSFMYSEKYRLYPKRCLDKELESYLPPSEAKGAAAFIMRCLSSYDPAKRPSASELLEDGWLLDVMGQRVS